MRSFSSKAMKAIPELIEGREAIFREQIKIARVRIGNATVLNDVLGFRISYIATPGLCGGDNSYQLTAHGGVLFATAQYLSGDYVGWQIYLSPEVIDKTSAIVAELGSEKTYLSDYIRKPIQKKDSKFSAVQTPGPVAKALWDFLREQQKTELSNFQSLLKIG